MARGMNICKLNTLTNSQLGQFPTCFKHTETVHEHSYGKPLFLKAGKTGRGFHSKLLDQRPEDKHPHKDEKKDIRGEMRPHSAEVYRQVYPLLPSGNLT